jgi:hypothetical protein
MSLQRDLAVIDLNVDGVVQPIVVATGRSPLSIVNPQTGEVLYNGPILDQAGTPVTSWGWTIAAGLVQGRPLAFVTATPPAAISGDTPLLAVIDLANPRVPVALGTVPFAGQPFGQSVVVRGDEVFIGTDSGTVIVSLADPTQPRLIGSIDSVGGRLALTAIDLLFGSVRAATEQQHALGGLRVGAVGSAIPLLTVSPTYALVDLEASYSASQWILRSMPGLCGRRDSPRDPPRTV